MNKNYFGLILVVCSLLVTTLVVGCGDHGGGGSGGGDRNPTVSVSELFDVSGATAIAAASSSTVSTSDIRAMSGATVTELLKWISSEASSAASLESVLTDALTRNYHPPISLIETGPDGSLYVGFQWSLWIRNEAGVEGDAAFFKITPAGVVSVVDDVISGVGTWYGDSNNGELPVKQLQFDSAGNLYYLGRGTSGSTILKKKTTAGVISQIGNDRMEVRDFLVTPDGLVFFHGSNAGAWSIEWLRVVDTTNSVHNLFYNDGSNGYLRCYYRHKVGDTNYVYLVGENMTLLDGIQTRNISGIVKVTLTATGAASAITVLYDDNNMYSDSYGTIGGQLVWGYWDDVAQKNQRFFAYDTYGNLIVPLSLEAGVTEAQILAYIRAKFQTTTTDNLADIIFAGLTTTEAWPNKWDMSYRLDDLINTKIAGTTWASWKETNGLQGVRFGNAKQVLFPDDGNLYAILKLDTWNSGSAKGDKLFRIVNSSGALATQGFLQDEATYYKSMSKARACGDYVIYLSNKAGQYKILRLDLRDATLAPVDLIPDKTNIEIFGFTYDAAASKIYYDVYDLDNNTSYMAEQLVTLTAVAAEISAEGYTVTEVVPFEAE